MAYSSKAYDVNTLEAARDIILTPRNAYSPKQRWEKETPYLAELLIQKLEITRESIVLDFGCGVGRVAKELIDQTKCIVYGIDDSMKMLHLANEYVNSKRFKPMLPDLFKHIIKFRTRAFDAAFSIWTMQHVQYPLDELNLIYSALKPDGLYLQSGEHLRCVPQDDGSWLNDEINVWTLASKVFDKVEDLAVETPYPGCLWTLWRKL